MKPSPRLGLLVVLAVAGPFWAFVTYMGLWTAGPLDCGAFVTRAALFMLSIVLFQGVIVPAFWAVVTGSRSL